MLVATNVSSLVAGWVHLQLKCRLLSLSWINMSAVIGDSTSAISSQRNHKNFVFFAAFVENCALVEKDFSWGNRDMLANKKKREIQIYILG